MQTYQRLSFLDTSFLALETRTTHMHVASVGLFEAGPMRLEDGGIDIERIRRYVESRLHMIPRYRQRLAFVPIERHPVWVDDEFFNLEYHVRHTSLPKPGTEQQLLDLAGRVLSQQLDRSKPLWELWVVEGLEDDRFGVISKVHH
ncbi:MAG: wax ester/triacylglycerol synthase family O-acyltransferase, partial [Acidimicrobiia bacterium]|nr:wax ester/triacylglycerol synthase family O-acyltransferase [Acidimicrobiia bacterium]